MDMRHQFDPADCPAAPARPRRSAWKRALIDVPTYPRRVEDSRSLLVPRAEALPEARRRAIARTVREERASLGARAGRRRRGRGAGAQARGRAGRGDLRRRARAGAGDGAVDPRALDRLTRRRARRRSRGSERQGGARRSRARVGADLVVTTFLLAGALAPGDRDAGARRPAYLPLNTGLRFSRKAATPSR